MSAEPNPSESATLPPSSPESAPALSEVVTVAPEAGVSAGLVAVASVPGYELLGELGRGGMGVVYRARQVKADRVVALKMILAGGHAGAADLTRFQTEAEAIARLRHPNIVQVYEVGEHDGLPFFSLEFCDGGSLEKKLGGTPLPAREAAALVEALARAVQAAHEHQIIHRDLKPANVLLLDDGTPKITDFGLAKKLDEAGQTRSGAIMGTPSYMAPEQAGGKGKEVGPAADVYALGAILYECLTGRPPFKAATALDTILQVTTDEPVPPVQLQSKTPRDLETICLKCLRKEPAQRYASAAELAEDLRRFRAGEPIRARPASALERAAKWAKRRPAVAALIGVVAAAAAAILALVVVNDAAVRQERNIAQAERNTAQTERDTAQREKTEADRLRVVAEDRRKAARRNLYTSQINLAHGAWRDAQIARMIDLLQNWLPGDEEEEDLRGFEWHYLWRLCHAGRGALQVTGSPKQLAWLPDGRRLAVLSAKEGIQREGAVSVWDTVAGKQLLSIPQSVHEDGPIRVIGDDRLALPNVDKSGALSVTVRDATSGDVRERFQAEQWTAGFGSLSADGRVVAGRTRQAGVQIYRLPDAKGFCLNDRLSDDVLAKWAPLAPVLDPAGRRMADWRARPAVGLKPDETTVFVVLVDFPPDDAPLSARAAVRFLLKGHTKAVLALEFSRDGSLVASAGMDGVVNLWETASGKHLHQWNPGEGRLTCLAFDPNTRMLAAAGNGRTVHCWDVKTGAELRSFKGHLDSITALAFSPKGDALASAGADGAVTIWDLNRRDEIRKPQGELWMVMNVAFGPDSKTLAVGAIDQSALNMSTIWDVETLTARKPVPDMGKVFFGPDPEKLLVFSTAGDRDHVRTFDLKSGELLSELRLPTKTRGLQVRSATVDSQGKRLAVDNGRNEVELWDLAAKKLTHTLKLPLAGTLQSLIEFSPDGNTLLTAVQVQGKPPAVVQLWDAVTGKELRTLEGPWGEVVDAAFSADGRRVGVAHNRAEQGRRNSKGEFKVWNLERSEVELVLSPNDFLTAAAFGPDDRRIVVADRSGVVRLFDAQTRDELLSLPTNPPTVQSLLFSPDGRRLAAVLAEFQRTAAIKIWDAVPMR
jgi:WD40 repeat protein